MNMPVRQRVSGLQRKILAICLILALYKASFVTAGAPQEPTSDYKIRKIITVALDLPKNFVPSSLPTESLDTSIRVALILPKFDPEHSAAFLSMADYSDSGEVASANRIILNFAEPASIVLPRMISRLFPRTEALRVLPENARYDLVLQVDLSSRIVDYGDGTFRGAEVRGIITVLGADEKVLGHVEAVGSADAAKPLYWTGKTRAQAVGVPALQVMLGQLVHNLVADPSLNAYLRGICGGARAALGSRYDCSIR
jgi:hypothetical protein